MLSTTLKTLVLAFIAVTFSGCLAAKNTGEYKVPPLSGLYAGGVAGVSDLANPANSESYRAAGGLYLHNNGWTSLSETEKERVLQTFQGAPIALELGFNPGWGEVYKNRYLSHGIRPVFIAANAFEGNKHPTAEQWRSYMEILRANGVPQSTLILPTFEYQNFKPNLSTLSENTFSLSPTFQEIAMLAGGIVLDTPSGYTMRREQAYRDWVTDAIQWTKNHGLTSIVILSPHVSGIHWNEDTHQYINYLQSHNAMPNVFVCENYTASPPPNYPNRVGNEHDPNTAIGLCSELSQKH